MGGLADAAKLYGEPDEWTEDEAPARLKTLAVVATQFLRAGGSVTLADFAALSMTERAIMAVCADQLRGDDPLPETTADIQSVLADFMEANRG